MKQKEEDNERAIVILVQKSTYWMTAMDRAASKLSSRYGRLSASQMSTCGLEQGRV